MTFPPAESFPSWLGSLERNPTDPFVKRKSHLLVTCEALRLRRTYRMNAASWKAPSKRTGECAWRNPRVDLAPLLCELAFENQSLAEEAFPVPCTGTVKRYLPPARTQTVLPSSCRRPRTTPPATRACPCMSTAP